VETAAHERPRSLLSDRPVLVLLGKPDCGLCREMREVVEHALPALGAELVERDITEDAELERRYVFDIPVLLYDGREVARHRIGADELLPRLRAAGFRSR
jgi:thiol-disulfide isomerase/thioredoxin